MEKGNLGRYKKSTQKFITRNKGIYLVIERQYLISYAKHELTCHKRHIFRY